jgi:hypothetical protein
VIVFTGTAEVSAERVKMLPGGPVAALAKRHGGSTYIFAVHMDPGTAKAAFQDQGISGKGEVEVLGENRRIAAEDGRFVDDFGPYEVHLYKAPHR